MAFASSFSRTCSSIHRYVRHSPSSSGIWGSPMENLTKPRVVRVPPAHPLRAWHVPLTDLDPRRRRDQVGQLVDRHQPVLTQVQGLGVIHVVDLPAARRLEELVEGTD